MITLAHVIAPFVAKPGSEWEIAQRVTVETMRQAKKNTDPSVRVDLLASVFPEDAAAIPEGLGRTADLRRSVLDIGAFRIPKKLPLLRDILENAAAATDAEYLMYTNVDIGLQTNFYDAVAHFIADGCDALTINRRTIDARWRDVRDLSSMQKEPGTLHRGNDCFVFRRELLPQFILGNVCLGTGHVDLPLVASMIACSRNFRLMNDQRLTFHIGDSLTWMQWKFRDYLVHNDREACKAVRLIKKNRRLSFLAEILLWSNIPHNATIIHSLERAFTGASSRSARL